MPTSPSIHRPHTTFSGGGAYSHPDQPPPSLPHLSPPHPTPKSEPYSTRPFFLPLPLVIRAGQYLSLDTFSKRAALVQKLGLGPKHSMPHHTRYRCKLIFQTPNTTRNKKSNYAVNHPIYFKTTFQNKSHIFGFEVKYSKVIFFPDEGRP